MIVICRHPHSSQSKTLYGIEIRVGNISFENVDIFAYSHDGIVTYAQHLKQKTGMEIRDETLTKVMEELKPKIETISTNLKKVVEILKTFDIQHQNNILHFSNIDVNANNEILFVFHSVRKERVAIQQVMPDEGEIKYNGLVTFTAEEFLKLDNIIFLNNIT